LVPAPRLLYRSRWSCSSMGMSDMLVADTANNRIVRLTGVMTSTTSVDLSMPTSAQIILEGPPLNGPIGLASIIITDCNSVSQMLVIASNGDVISPSSNNSSNMTSNCNYNSSSQVNGTETGVNSTGTMCSNSSVNVNPTYPISPANGSTGNVNNTGGFNNSSGVSNSSTTSNTTNVVANLAVVFDAMSGEVISTRPLAAAPMGANFGLFVTQDVFALSAAASSSSLASNTSSASSSSTSLLSLSAQCVSQQVVHVNDNDNTVRMFALPGIAFTLG